MDSQILKNLKNTKCTAIKFSAKWCTPCQNKLFIDSYNNLKKIYSNNNNITFINFDVDQDEELVNSELLNFDIKSIPTIKIYYYNKEYSSYTGTAILNEVTQDIQNILSNL